jgi:hypothetical protein
MSPPKGKVKSKNDARVEYAELNPKLPDNEVVSLALQTIGSRAGRRPLSSPKEIDLLRRIAPSPIFEALHKRVNRLGSAAAAPAGARSYPSPGVSGSSGAIGSPPALACGFDLRFGCHGCILVARSSDRRTTRNQNSTKSVHGALSPP